jgi:RNA polymerase sigma factor (sigma-70 family)
MPRTLAPVRSRAEALALFHANQGLAFHVCNRYLRLTIARRLGRNEVEQVALLALWDAARLHDPALGTFASYAGVAIRRRLRLALDRFAAGEVLPLSSLGDEDGEPFQPVAPDEADSVLAADQSEEVGRLLSRLPQRWARILRMRYGLDDGVPLTFREIAARLGGGRQAAQQLEARALERLRKHVRRSRQPSPV